MGRCQLRCWSWTTLQTIPISEVWLRLDFNDSDPRNSAALIEEIEANENYRNLHYKPVVTNFTVDKELADTIASASLGPTFSFLDPFGYKGLSLELVRAVTKDWGCDCVFFFNYTRVNAGLSNGVMQDNMADLFGEARAASIRVQIDGLKPHEREAQILEHITQEIRDLGAKFVLPFTFKSDAGTRTRHKLIFVSKSFKGYRTMKSQMAKLSSANDEGVPTFQYCLADERMPRLFALQQPLSNLIARLPNDYSGQEFNREQLYQHDSVDTPFLEKDYRTALIELETKGRIQITSTNGKRKAGTFAEHVRFRFVGES